MSTFPYLSHCRSLKLCQNTPRTSFVLGQDGYPIGFHLGSRRLRDSAIANFVRCHTTVIRLLDRAKALGILEAVKDESHFWENRDMKALVETVGQWNRHVAGIVGQYKDQIGGVISAPITDYPDFEHLEADGRKTGRDPNL